MSFSLTTEMEEFYTTATVGKTRILPLNTPGVPRLVFERGMSDDNYCGARAALSLFGSMPCACGESDIHHNAGPWTIGYYCNIAPHGEDIPHVTHRECSVLVWGGE